MTDAITMTSSDPAGVATRTGLLTQWRVRSAEWERFGLMGNPRIVIDQLLADIECLLASEESEWIRSREAVARSGLDESSLRRLARSGQVKADKRGHLWWYLAGSLPRKASTNRTIAAFDPAAAARRANDRLQIRLV